MGSLYDLVVVGAGLTGCTIARLAKDDGKKVIILEKDELGGNCATEERDGFEIHKHGPHTWHTELKSVHYFMSRFANFRSYEHSKKGLYGDKYYQVPISYEQLGEEDNELIWENLILGDSFCDHSSFISYLVPKIGKNLFDIFYKNYSLKQWGTLDIPVEIAKRLPIGVPSGVVFTDRYQALPDNYNRMFERMVEGIEIVKADYSDERKSFDSLADRVVYTGSLDELFNYDQGVLSYRSLGIETERVSCEVYQPCASLNYLDDRPLLRSVDHGYFQIKPPRGFTYVSKIYAKEFHTGIVEKRYYPMWDYILYKKYLKRLEREKIIPAGRLGLYKYLNMDMAVYEAMRIYKEKIA